MSRKKSKNPLEDLYDLLESVEGDSQSRSREVAIGLIEEKLAAIEPLARFGRLTFFMEPARRHGKPFGFHWGVEGEGPKGFVQEESACETLEEAFEEAKAACVKVGRPLPLRANWDGPKPKLLKRVYGTVLRGQASKTAEDVHGRSSRLSTVRT